MKPDKIKELDKAHIIHSWSVQSQLDPMMFDHGKGAELWDSDGKRYLDFSSQLVNLNVGHQHPDVVDSVKHWAEKCCYINPAYAFESRSLLANKLAKITPDNINHFFFTLSGAESNENAIKIARLYTGKHKIISRYRSYHGASMGAISITGDPRRWPAEPGISGTLKVFDPYCYRCSFGLEYPSCKLRCAENVREVMMYEGAKDHVAAMVIESVTGTNGIFVPPDGYFQRLREICDEFGVLLVCDEVMSGFGRTGKWFAFDNWGIKPDLISMAKGLTSGYVPMGAVGVSDTIADFFQDNMLWCGLTYNNHPLCCGVAAACLEVYEKENLLQRSIDLGEICAEEFNKFMEKHKCVGDVRGIGLFRIIELVKDKQTREPISDFNTTSDIVKEAVKQLKQKGVLTLTHWNTIFVTPPLIIKEEELREGLHVIDEVLSWIDSKI